MVSIDGANSVVSLVAKYNEVSSAIAASQQAIAGKAAIQDVGAHVIVGGSEITLSAPTQMSPDDTATVLNALISVWQAQQAALAAQISAVT